MKRIICSFAVLLLLVSLCSAASAAESVEVSAGIKAWMNKWKRDFPDKDSIKSKDSYLVGAFIEGVEDNVFMEAAYSMSMPDYKFSDTGGDTQINRTDLDLAVGYLFSSGMGLFAGYRSSEFKEDETGVKETSSGPLIGIRLTLPVSGALSLAGQATYLYTRLKTDAGTESAPGWTWGLGLKYDFSKQLSANIGYQYETTKGKNTGIRDTFSGYTAGVTYIFQ